MSLYLILGLAILGFLLFAVLVSRVGPRMDERPAMHVEQELQGVGADQKEAPEGGERGTSLLG